MSGATRPGTAGERQAPGGTTGGRAEEETASTAPAGRGEGRRLCAGTPDALCLQACPLCPGTCNLRRGYDAWGNALGATGSTANPHTYVGRLRYYAMARAGPYHLGHRELAAGVERFLTVDPAKADHPCAYSDSRPAAGADPGGRRAGSLTCRRDWSAALAAADACPREAAAGADTHYCAQADGVAGALGPHWTYQCVQAWRTLEPVLYNLSKGVHDWFSDPANANAMKRQIADDSVRQSLNTDQVLLNVACVATTRRSRTVAPG